MLLIYSPTWIAIGVILFVAVILRVIYSYRIYKKEQEKDDYV